MSEIAELFTVNWTTWFITGFAILFALEKGIGGNHMGDAKYNYCMEHLPVVPVETKLIL